MHSIRTKITLLTIVAILVSVLSVGGVSTLSIKSEGYRSTNQEMTLICQNLEKTVDEYLDSISQSVDVISRYASEELGKAEMVDGGLLALARDHQLDHSSFTPKQVAQIDQCLSDHTDKIEDLFHSVARHTNGVVAYYYRFNTELSDDVKGFFYTKVANAAFVSQPLTDLSAYDRDDVEHVGWFYLPQDRGRASWLPSYYNANIDVTMTSYVCPLYKSGIFMGIIGMDISYDTLVRSVKEAKVYSTGYACLLEEDGTVIYHPKLEYGTKISAVFSDSAYALLSQLKATESKELLSFRVGGVDKMVAFTTLSNGMKLLVSAPVREITANWTQLIFYQTVASVLILLFFASIMAVTLGHITEPLRRLTEASRRISDGDYDVELDYEGNDELGILTGSFRHLVSHLRIYIKDLNSRAYRDALTGVKNKGAFDIYQRKLNDQLSLAEPGSVVEFAILMLDCNGLKDINDRCGHDKGDAYLRTACHHICNTYAHSPVFRLGGDEFAVLLQSEDYLRREELLTQFQERAAAYNLDAEQPWQRIDIAVGMAVCLNTDTSVESVLRRADEAMYENKRRSKTRKRAGDGVSAD